MPIKCKAVLLKRDWLAGKYSILIIPSTQAVVFRLTYGVGQNRTQTSYLSFDLNISLEVRKYITLLHDNVFTLLQHMYTNKYDYYNMEEKEW